MAPSNKRRAKSPLPETRGSKITKTTITARTTSTSGYSRNFLQNLIDHGIYPDEYDYPAGWVPPMPDNWEEINKRLLQSRSSLLSEVLTNEDFREFKRADARVSKEHPVMTSVIPLINGKGDPRCTGEDYLFANLAHLTDGTLVYAKPDKFFGARPEELEREVRIELGKYIIPTTQDDLPILPNFFLEAKGPDGSLAVLMRQACYNGAVGARGMHSLQSYQQEKSFYDNNAYTITSTYHGGQLKLYTTHPVNCHHLERPEYIMTQLGAWSMTGNYELFRQGMFAYRNARDWAKEKRDDFIRLANVYHLKKFSRRPATVNVAITLNAGDASTRKGEKDQNNKSEESILIETSENRGE